MFVLMSDLNISPTHIREEDVEAEWTHAHKRTLYIALYDHNYTGTRMYKCSSDAALAAFTAYIHGTCSACCCCSASRALFYLTYTLGRCVERYFK